MLDSTHILREVNETVIRSLLGNNIPWRSDYGFPTNIISRRKYDGVNAILLMDSVRRHKFNSQYWGTINEWEGLGGKVMPRPSNVDIDDWGTYIIVCLGSAVRKMQVFNLSQVDDNFPSSRDEKRVYSTDAIDKFVANTKVEIREVDEGSEGGQPVGRVPLLVGSALQVAVRVEAEMQIRR